MTTSSTRFSTQSGTVSQFVDVLVTLAVFAALDVGVRQFVHNRNLRLAGQDGIDVHFFEDRALVVDFPAGHLLKLGG